MPSLARLRLLLSASVLFIGVDLTHAAPDTAEGVFELDYARSTLIAITRREGALAFLGHDHAVIAALWKATVRYNPADPRSSGGDVTVHTDALAIDSGDARRVAAMENSGPGPENLRKIQKQMLGSGVLDAATYPTIHFSTLSVEATQGTQVTLKGQLTLRGITRDVAVAATVEPDRGSAWHFFGTLKFRQSDFGITPTSVFGVVKVRDEVEVRFDLYGTISHGQRREGSRPLSLVLQRTRPPATAGSSGADLTRRAEKSQGGRSR